MGEAFPRRAEFRPTGKHERNGESATQHGLVPYARASTPGTCPAPCGRSAGSEACRLCGWFMSRRKLVPFVEVFLDTFAPAYGTWRSGELGLVQNRGFLGNTVTLPRAPLSRNSAAMSLSRAWDDSPSRKAASRRTKTACSAGASPCSRVHISSRNP